jgi:hypothetical protein
MLLGMRARVPVRLAVVALLVLAAMVAEGASAVPVGGGKLFGWAWTFSKPRELLGKPYETPAQSGLWTQVFGSFVLFLPLILLGLAILLGVVLSIRRRHRKRTGSPTVGEEEPRYPDAPPGRLLRAARAAQAELDKHTGGPPSDAVIAAWVRLEEAAAESGTRRRADQTPTEFTDAVRAGHDAVGAALNDLRGLYHRARFGARDTVGPAEADAARAALADIVHALGDPAVVAP